jgi:hypothetical protein
MKLIVLGTVIDPKTGDNRWNASKRWGNSYTGFHSAITGLVDSLMKRINEDETEPLASRPLVIDFLHDRLCPPHRV